MIEKVRSGVSSSSIAITFSQEKSTSEKEITRLDSTSVK